MTRSNFHSNFLSVDPKTVQILLLRWSLPIIYNIGTYLPDSKTNNLSFNFGSWHLPTDYSNRITVKVRRKTGTRWSEETKNAYSRKWRNIGERLQIYLDVFLSWPESNKNEGIYRRPTGNYSTELFLQPSTCLLYLCWSKEASFPYTNLTILETILSNLTVRYKI